MKLNLLALSFVIALTSIGQITFYDANGSKKKTIGSRTYIEFNEDRGINTRNTAEGAAGMGALLTALIPKAIDLGWTIGTKAIENRVAKFAHEFTKGKTYTGNENKIPEVKLIRKIVPKGGGAEEIALEITFTPLSVSQGRSFVYEVTNVQLNYSAAKTKKKYAYNDYTVEFEFNYFNGKEKKEQKAEPFTMELIGFGTNNLKDSNGDYLYTTEQFVITDTMMFTEVNIKIVETNPAKVKAEKVKGFVDENGEKIKEGLDVIVNNYFGEEEEDEETKDDDDAAAPETDEDAEK